MKILWEYTLDMLNHHSRLQFKYLGKFTSKLAKISWPSFVVPLRCYDCPNQLQLPATELPRLLSHVTLVSLLPRWPYSNKYLKDFQRISKGRTESMKWQCSCGTGCLRRIASAYQLQMERDHSTLGKMQLRRHCLWIRTLENFGNAGTCWNFASAPFLEVDLIGLEAQNQANVNPSIRCSLIPAAWRHRYLPMLTFGWRQSRSKLCWRSCASPLPRHFRHMSTRGACHDSAPRCEPRRCAGRPSPENAIMINNKIKWSKDRNVEKKEEAFRHISAFHDMLFQVYLSHLESPCHHLSSPHLLVFCHYSVKATKELSNLEQMSTQHHTTITSIWRDDSHGRVGMEWTMNKHDAEIRSKEFRISM